MSTATIEQVQTQFQMIELGKITPSPMNPRKHFDEKSLKELAESIKTHGVQQPIVVRPEGNKKERFEIVVGERRFRACKLAGLDSIPAIIRPLSNAAALEIMVIENLQREDVHPLDEALGYEALMKKSSDSEAGDLPGAPRHTAESIAAKVGKSVGYVYARLKLLALVPASREAFEQNHITAGHAVLIARLQPKDQIYAINACLSGDETKFRYDALKKLDPHEAKFGDIIDRGYDMDSDFRVHHRLLPEKGLRDWIQENVNLKLKGVPWDLDDELLVPWAGPCSLCSKRSMLNPALFAELTKKGEDDTCFDPECFKEKQKAYIKRAAKDAKNQGTPLVQISEQTAYTKPKEGEKILKAGRWLPAKVGECESVEKALIVRGEDAGKNKIVCTDLNCKVHKRHLQNGSIHESLPHATPEQRAAAEEEQKAIEERNRKFKLLVFDKVRAKLTDRAIIELFFEAAVDGDGISIYQLSGLLAHRGWKGQTEKVLRDKTSSLPLGDAWKLMAEMLLWGDIEDSYKELGRYLPAVAKACKIDIAKLSKEFQESQTPAKPEKVARKKAGKKGKR